MKGCRRMSEESIVEGGIVWDGMGQNRRVEDVVGKDSRGCGGR